MFTLWTSSSVLTTLEPGYVFVKPATFACPRPNPPPNKPIHNRLTTQIQSVPNMINLSDDSDRGFPRMTFLLPPLQNN